MIDKVNNLCSAGVACESAAPKIPSLCSEMEKNREITFDIEDCVGRLKRTLGADNEDGTKSAEAQLEPCNLYQAVLYQQCALQRVLRDLGAIDALMG